MGPVGSLGGRAGHRGTRPGPAPPRPAAELPGGGPRPLPDRGDRTGAAPVRRGGQRRGTPLQPGPAPLGLRLRQAGEQLLRVRHRQRRRAHPRLRDHQAPHVRPDRAHASAGWRRIDVVALREGPRGRPRPPRGLPPRLGGQPLRDELRVAVRPGRRGAQPGGRGSRVSAQHRRGQHLAVPPVRRRAGLADRDRVLRLPRRAGPVRPGTAEGGCRRVTGAGAGDQAEPGRQAGPGRPAARGEGHAGDRRDPRDTGREGLREPVAAHDVPQRRRAARLGRAAGGRDRAACGPSATWSSGRSSPT
jgi:hypothetical protein